MVIALLLSMPTAVAAQDLTALDAVLRERMAKSQVPGMVIATVAPDGTIVERGYGVRSVETREPVRADDLFRTGSVNKMWTAAVLLKVMEQRGHSIDKPLGSFIKGLRPTLARLTVAQILSHQSGLADSNATENDFDEDALAASIKEIDTYQFFAEPGGIMSYSNRGFQLAGYVIEKLTGQRYADAVETLLLAPIGARRTFHRPLMAMTFPLAVGHALGAPGGAKVVRPMPFSARAMPSGYPFTTASDAMRFARMMMAGGKSESGAQVLSPAVIAAMTTAHAPLPEAFGELSYGYGAWISERQGQRVWDHGGSIDGYNATLRLHPDRKVAVVVLVNVGAPGFVEEIADVVLRHLKVLAPLAPKPATSAPKPATPRKPVPPALAADLIGQWGQGTWVFTVRRRGEALEFAEGASVIGTLHDGGTDRLAMVAPSGQSAGTIAVVRNPQGAVTYLAWGARAITRLPRR